MVDCDEGEVEVMSFWNFVLSVVTLGFCGYTFAFAPIFRDPEFWQWMITPVPLLLMFIVILYRIRTKR